MIGQSFPTTAETDDTNIKKKYVIKFRDNRQMIISMTNNDITELKRILLSLNKPGFVAIGTGIINTDHIVYIVPNNL